MKVSKDKLVVAEETVTYLGRKMSQGKREVCEKHIQAVKHYPKPTTVKEMLGFLGTVGFCSDFITEYAEKCRCLRDMMKEAGVKNLGARLIWNIDKDKAFVNLKQETIAVTKL
ncbi:hypothetical protein DPEC_G00201260 [Dallia pectoralis]|uniref:Uncharacterized protein n=1 Tax=Dallia pectoralis TaxID=75939 RepID=A0ACC2G903_DALPE|nr:hypothetical protein DPEC_G00201260 [Dallia pectoralis]